MIIGTFLTMENIELKQMVRLDHDSEKMVEQSVTFDPNDDWVHLVHDSNEISLNRDNWENLKALADKATKTKIDLEEIVNLGITWLKENKKDNHHIIIKPNKSRLVYSKTETKFI